ISCDNYDGMELVGKCLNYFINLILDNYEFDMSSLDVKNIESKFKDKLKDKLKDKSKDDIIDEIYKKLMNIKYIYKNIEKIENYYMINNKQVQKLFFIFNQCKEKLSI